MSLLHDFPYDEPAEVYATDGRGTRKRPVNFRRFASSAEAIRFAVEQLPQILHRDTVMETGADCYEFAAIRALFHRFPLRRDGDDEADGTGPSRDGSAG